MAPKCHLATISIDAPLWEEFGRLVEAEHQTRSGLLRQLILREVRAAAKDGRLPATKFGTK